MLASFSRPVTLVDGRMLVEYPLRQIVRWIVAWVTAGFSAPGVQCKSGILNGYWPCT
jgi:hypothetical protein